MSVAFWRWKRGKKNRVVGIAAIDYSKSEVRQALEGELEA